MSQATLHAIGVGPGDPELLTLKAVRLLGSCRRVFAARSSKNEQSLALEIASAHLPPGVRAEMLDFPMTRDKGVLAAAWQANARAVLDALAVDGDCAFLTLGDPMTYSTFGYLARTMLAMDPAACIRVVPGVTSVAAAAARTATVLAEGDAPFTVVPGTLPEEQLTRVLARPETVVILKAYRNYPAIHRVLGAAGRAGEALFVSRVGLEGETWQVGLPEPGPTPPYFSLILVPGPANGRS